jgi:lysozyme family protein
MGDAFAKAFAIVIGEEGGYCNDAADPGGATKYGISHAAYPDLDIPNLTLAGAQAIYQRDYWDKIAGDRLDPGLALLVFDAAVNNGVGRATEWLQVAARVAVDGVIGDVTVGAANQNVVATCAEFMARRMLFMASLSTWKNFGLGWARRLCMLPYQAATMAGRSS